MMHIPYNLFGTELPYRSWSALEKEIKSFNSNTKIIGRGACNSRNIYSISLGRTSGPTIFILASVHGAEWHSAIFALKFMKMLRDNTFPDKKFRTKLLSKYNVVCVPVGNPWGYANKTRLNYNNVDINRDYVDFTQPETRAIRKHFKDTKALSFLDLHLMQPTYSTWDLIFAAGNDQSYLINEGMANSLQMNTKIECGRWGKGSSGMGRNWAGRQTSSHGGHIVSVLTEITRDDIFPGKRIMEYGLLQQYIFVKYAMKYFEERIYSH